VHAIPVLLVIMTGLVIALTAWGFLRIRRREVMDAPLWRLDPLLLVLLAIAIFALGVLVTILVLGLVPEAQMAA
jgi:polyferredoxin